ncbi:MAG TPA: chromosome segregation protein ScpA [Candidatus Omnitrophica bacterium]|nr:chromosome segregation protein ScpA [Candidatus Omnitrophota bacterium]
MSHKIKLHVFEGPLDLLLYLIKKDEINIYDIPITQVTEQYMKYLDLMELLDLDIAGEFLVIAASLVHIKSKMLLPRDPQEEEEEIEDPRTDLVEKLLEYKRFKEVAEDLRSREQFKQTLFTRKPEIKEKDPNEVYFETSLFELISAFSNALKDIPKDVFYEVIKDEFTVDEKIHDILHSLFKKSKLKLSELFEKAKNNLEMIATFLAILELIKIKEVKIMQKALFDEIEIMRNEDNIIPVSSAQAQELDR